MLFLVRFRTIPINTELKAFNDAIDVFMLDPNGYIMKRWLSRQSNLGSVSLDYQLSDQPVFGEWKIRVIAQGQIEESTFLVEEYYQTRFEVNVTMPAFFFNSDEYIHGVVMANYTSGAPVHGNLTLKAVVRPIRPIRYNKITRVNRPRPGDHSSNRNPFSPYEREREFQYENANTNNPYAQPGGRDLYERYDNSYNKPIIERYFDFNEQFPFWMTIPDRYYEPIPNLKSVSGNSGNVVDV